MPPLIRRLLRLAFYLACTMIAALSLAPSTALPPVPLSDKAEHVIAYALLGLLAGISSERGGVLRPILGLAGFGLAIEVLQSFSPGRSPDVFDLLADVIGACLGCGVAAGLRTAMTWMWVDRPVRGTTGCPARDASSDI